MVIVEGGGGKGFCNGKRGEHLIEAIMGRNTIQGIICGPTQLKNGAHMIYLR
jgi:hypothetical protein